MSAETSKKSTKEYLNPSKSSKARYFHFYFIALTPKETDN